MQCFFFLLATSLTGVMTQSTMPPNFVPMIEATAKPVVLPDILTAADERGEFCTLASLDATVVVWPKGDESQEVRIEMPDQVSTTSSDKCPPSASASSGSRLKPLMAITWSSFQLCFYMATDESNWSLDRIVFAFNSSELTETKGSGDIKVFASGPQSLVDIGAPLGKSYRCWAQKQFPLLNGRDNATLLLGNFQLQPFLDGQKVFGEETVCAQDKLNRHHGRRHRDTTVTIAVGSTLAVLAVLTVLGYGIFRHMKIKAVGYDTMH